MSYFLPLARFEKQYVSLHWQPSVKEQQVAINFLQDCKVILNNNIVCQIKQLIYRIYYHLLY